MIMAYFSNYDVFICFSSILTYVADVLTDVIVIALFFVEGHAIWGSMSLCFVAVAAILMQIFSFHWHVTDKTASWRKLFLHMIFLAPLHRYVSVLQLGLKSRQFKHKDDLNAAYRALNDVSILRLFETFLESAPQLVLQLYIITSDLRNIEPFVGVSCIFSVLSVAWAVTAYTDALHLAYKKIYKRSAMSLVMHVVWQTGMITSRVSAVVLFASAFHGLVAIPLGKEFGNHMALDCQSSVLGLYPDSSTHSFQFFVSNQWVGNDRPMWDRRRGLALHAVAMVVWIVIIKPEFGSNICEKVLFTIVAAIVHSFCFLNLKDGNSRWRMLFFYIVFFIENTTFFCLWFAFKDAEQPSWLDAVGFTAVFGGFFLGMVSLLTYYCCCHPSGPVPITDNRNLTSIYRSQNQPSFNQNEVTVNNSKQSIFKTPTSSAAMVNQWLHASLDLTKEGIIENPDNYLDTNLHTYRDGQGDFSPYCYKDSIARNLNVPDTGQSQDRKAQNNSECRNQPGPMDNTAYNTSNSQEQYSLPSSVIIDLFSRSNLSPGNYSTLSLNRSPVYGDSTVRQADGDRSRSRSKEREKPGCSNVPETRSKGNPRKPTLYENISPVISESMNYSPAQISPLDPYKLLEESESMIAPGSCVRGRLDSDEILNGVGMESTPILSVQPDVARGITRLSLSYSALDEADGCHSLPENRRCYDYSSENSSLMQTRVQKNTRTPTLIRPGLRKSDELTFSNMSLPLPDESLRSRLSHSQTLGQHLNPSKLSLKSDRSIDDSITRGKKISPLYSVIKNRSVDSFYINSPIDRQSSYLSDHGLCSSDQVLSVTDSSNNRSRRSLTSSGFQSEETTYSSPGNILQNHGNHSQFQSNYGNHSQFQSTPTVENEIASIQDPPLSLRVLRPRVSLDADVQIENPKMESFRSMSASEQPSMMTDNQPRSASTTMYYNSLEQIDSPSLPPLTVSSQRLSSTGSGNSGKFFKSLIDDGENDHPLDQSSDGSDTNRMSFSQDKRRRYSTHNEQSSLSEFLSNVSSSLPGNTGQSDESISLTSDPEKLSQPSTSVGVYHKSVRGETNPTVPLYENTENFPCISNKPRPEIQERSTEGESVGDSFDNDSGTSQSFSNEQSFDRHSNGKSSLQPNRTTDQLGYAPVVDNYEHSPEAIGTNQDLFNRDKWRASLDKEMKERLVGDVEKYAPRKLYKLHAKNDSSSRRRVSPLTISEYNDSPYKFRRQAKQQPDYVNIDNVSPDSLSSAYEHVHIVTPGVYTDYENVYNLNSLQTGNCPLVRPESLSDSLILDDGVSHSSNSRRRGVIVSEPCDSHIVTTCSPLSMEMSGAVSPINTSGVNSAFKPVKPRRSVDSETSAINSSNKSSNISSNYSGHSEYELSPRNDSCSNILNSKSESPLFVPNHTYNINCTTNDSTQNSQIHHSAASSISSSNDSKLQSFDLTGHPSMNFLKLAGTAPFSFSLPYIPTGEGSSRNSTHSYSNSIPWEDSENISTSFQSNRSGSIRQPLRSLENTPVFSPIYGLETKINPPSVARKRFMSTPIVPSGVEGKDSRTPGRARTAGRSLGNCGTPRRQHSRLSKNNTFNDDTSTWSAHSTSGQEWALETNERSSLSKTTYI